MKRGVGEETPSGRAQKLRVERSTTPPSLWNVGRIADTVTRFTKLRCGYPEASRLAWRAVCRSSEESVARVARADGSPASQHTGTRTVRLSQSSRMPSGVAALLLGGEARDVRDSTRTSSLVVRHQRLDRLGNSTQQASPAAGPLAELLRRPTLYLPAREELRLEAVVTARDAWLLAAVASSPRAPLLRKLAVAAESSFDGRTNVEDIGSLVVPFTGLHELSVTGSACLHITQLTLRGIGRMTSLRSLAMHGVAVGTQRGARWGYDAARFGKILATQLPHLTSVSLKLGSCGRSPVRGICQAFTDDYFAATHSAPLVCLDVERSHALCPDLVSEVLVRHPQLRKCRCGTETFEVSRVAAAGIPIPILAGLHNLSISIDGSRATADRVRRLVTELAPLATSLSVISPEETADVEAAAVLGAALTGDDAARCVAPQLRELWFRENHYVTADQRLQMAQHVASPRWVSLGIPAVPVDPDARFGRTLLRCTSLLRLGGSESQHRGSEFPHIAAALATRSPSEGTSESAAFAALVLLNAQLPADEIYGPTPVAPRMPVIDHWRAIERTLRGTSCGTLQTLRIETHAPTSPEGEAVIASTFEAALSVSGSAVNRFAVAVSTEARVAFAEALVAVVRRHCPLLGVAKCKYIGDADDGMFEGLRLEVPGLPPDPTD